MVIKSDARVYADNLPMWFVERWCDTHDADSPDEELGWFELWVEAQWCWLGLMHTSQLWAWNEYVRGRSKNNSRRETRTIEPWEEPAPIFYQHGEPVKISDSNYDENRGQQ